MSDPTAPRQPPPRQHPLAAALLEAFEHHRDAVLQAPTGAGKSTIVPLALLQAPLLAGGRILMLEPRRLAARAVAARMASLLGESVGDTVGYRMRLDTRVSRMTRIEVITEGVLTRLLQQDPALEGVACLIFDEYHERSLAADLGLALALDARRELAAAFRLLVMSATMEGERVAALLGDAALVNVPGRAFEVDIRYLGRGLPLLPPAAAAPEAAALERALGSAVRRALEESSGDVLVFLPGAGEIRRLQRALLEAGLPPPVQLLPLYGDLSAASQDAALEPAAAGRRKVVLATNIAETSLTIPGVTAVVDSGLVRRSRFDPSTGMSRLALVRISRAASEQRAGRAGRVASGRCYRLWSEGAQASLAAATPPEILETDLAALALELSCWGVTDAAQLQWLDAPPPSSLQQARELLSRLDALDAAARPTALGRRMAALPVHPRLAHMLLAARSLGAVRLAAQLAALLSERDLLRHGADRERHAGAAHDPDLRTRLGLLRGEPQPDAADRYLLERVQRSARMLEAALPGAPGDATAAEAVADEQALPGALLALAFPDRIGQRRDGAEGRYLLANGRGAAFAGAPALAREPFVVAVELDDRAREARIELAVPLSRAWIERLFAAHIVAEDDFGWQAREAAVVARRVRRLQALVLEDRPQPVAADERAVAAMLEGVRQLGIAALPWDDASRGLQARMQFVRSLGRKDLADWPGSDDLTLMAQVGQWLGPYLGGVTRRAQLSRVPLAEALRSRLDGAQLRALESLAPRELAVPSGSHARIDYLDDNAPCVAVRLQEVFGLMQTPHIGGGAVPVTFKLLSPAQRPVQITRDLAGFWRSSYAQVRKDMRGRYPKHHWPEDPLSAAPTRATKRGAGRPPRG